MHTPNNVINAVDRFLITEYEKKQQNNKNNNINNKVSPGGGERICPRRQLDPKIAADLRPSADGSAVRTSLVAAGG